MEDRKGEGGREGWREGRIEGGRKRREEGRGEMEGLRDGGRKHAWTFKQRKGKKREARSRKEVWEGSRPGRRRIFLKLISIRAEQMNYPRYGWALFC